MSINAKRLQSFLDQFRLIKEKHDEVARANGERFNVFSVLGVENAEVRHSAFLAELLNPNGAHSQGAVFLRLFFDMLRNKFSDKFHWFDDGINGFDVTVEASVKDGRVDILIENDDKCMVIENKINATDQDEQLGRYYRGIADRTSNKKDVIVIYLTLWGSDASEQTRGNLPKKKLLCVSYSEDIINWLDGCLKETVRLAHIRETLFQYQSLLKQLTGQTLNRRFIVDTNALFSKPENYRLVPELEQAILEFRFHIESWLWREVCDKFNDSGFGDANLDEQLKAIEHKIKNNCTPGVRGKGDYGLTLPIENSDIDFAIFAEFAYKAKIFFFFKKRDKVAGAEISPEDRADWNEKFEDAMEEKELVSDRWYLCWKYYRYKEKELRLSLDALCEENAGDALLSEREEIVDDIVSQTQDIIKRFFGGG